MSVIFKAQKYQKKLFKNKFFRNIILQQHPKTTSIPYSQKSLELKKNVFFQNQRRPTLLNGLYVVKIIAINGSSAIQRLIKEVTVVATANDSSGISGNMIITISNQITGIHEINNFQASIYPNPTTGLIAINTTEILESIEVYEITGKQIARYTAVNTLDLSSLPKGIYIIKLYSENSVAIQQVVKRQIFITPNHHVPL